MNIHKIIKHTFTFTFLSISLCSCQKEPVAPIVEYCTISFDSDGGSEVKPITTTKGKKIKEVVLPTPTKENYVFEHWTFQDDTTIPQEYVVENDITLKAHYIASSEHYIKSLNIKPIVDKYLYEMTFTDYDYSEGEEWLSKKLEINPYQGLCSSVYSNGYYGRNYDGMYDNSLQAIVHTTKTTDRHATLGIALPIELTSSTINTTKNVNGHKMIPFLTIDGINDAGLVASINEIPYVDVGHNPGSDPEHTQGKENLSVYMLVRMLLDKASDIEEAKILLEKFNIHNRSSFLQEMHISLADAKGNAAVIEFENPNGDKTRKVPVFYENKKDSKYKGITTNFTFTDYQGDSKTWTGDSSLQNHAEGVERYNILYDEIITNQKQIQNHDEMLDLMAKVYYSKTYSFKLEDHSKDFWFSEFNFTSTGPNKYTDQTVQNYNTSYYQSVMKAYNSKKRASGYYISRSSSAYDLKNQTLKMVFEENNRIETIFSLEQK